MVKITGYALSLGKSITIERSVKSPSTPTITPNDAMTREFVTKLETHPEFALSRRQIIKYILTPPGRRSTDVQTLLRLEQVEKARTSLLRVMNDTKKEATRADTDDSRAKQEFFQHLGLRTPSKSDLLAALNERRTLLKLEPLRDLAPGASIKAGVTADKLKRSDVSGAAHTLRRYLEYIATILADNLRARIEYHANGQYDLGDLWPAIVRAWKGRLQEAKESAVSRKKGVAEVEAIQKDAKQKIADTQSENWMINKAVRYNQWANLHARIASLFAQELAQSRPLTCAPSGKWYPLSYKWLRPRPVRGKQ